MKWLNATVKIRTSVLVENIQLEIKKGDVLGITGNNGSGKTVLAKAIAGKLPVSGEITEDGNFTKKYYVPFHSSLTLMNGGAVYRQQRWNKIDSELLPKVSDEIRKSENPVLAESLMKSFGLYHLNDSFVINLSNGEQRKLELVRALSTKPDLLVLDNAFTGLDSAARVLLAEMLEVLIKQGQTLVMTGLQPDDFPQSMQNFIVLNNGRIEQNCRRNDIKLPEHSIEIEADYPAWNRSEYEELINLEEVSLQYGERIILDKINWRVLKGECWSLSGPNGSGKTSLLNLIFGDNPKAYGSNIRLFGKPKGSGESIWDIKAKTGFVSPEFHQYLPQNQTVTDVICSGFSEAESSFKKPTGYQRDVACRWLKTLNYQSVQNRIFGELSTSAQRIILLIRTLVKNPPLLILDEPFQGLDQAHIGMLKDLLNRITAESDCAMIFVTHIPSELPECFKKHLKLKNGVVIDD